MQEINVLFFIATITLIGVLVQHFSNVVGRGVSFAMQKNRPADFADGMLARAGNALRNGIESGMMMAPFVLILLLNDVSTAASRLAAAIYVLARIAYHVFYIAGVPMARSASWLISIIAICVMGYAAFTALGA
ncbi:MAPEG family protein [Celeribacter arenosi]|uniref:MAPEG family protein n=1 Tax=Celeribacter arenosi TaxID=792649 RepID=A0ABP7K093_9RHOB